MLLYYVNIFSLHCTEICNQICSEVDRERNSLNHQLYNNDVWRLNPSCHPHDKTFIVQGAVTIFNIVFLFFLVP